MPSEILNVVKLFQSGVCLSYPKAAGSFSSEEYSLTVKVKLLRAIPRKNPAIQSHAIIDVRSVCSAKTTKD